LKVEELHFSNSQLLKMLAVVVVGMASWFIILFFVFHATLGNIIFAGVGATFMISVIFGMIIYRQRFRDERFLQILDRSGRNGFVFMAYILPLIVEIFALTGVSMEVVLVLAGFWCCSLVVLILSAIHYYR
jgi:hypothetical protein